MSGMKKLSDAELVEWGKKSGYGDYTNNKAMLAFMYARKHQPKNVSELFEGSLVSDFNVYVMAEVNAIVINVCTKCGRKECDCGLKDYGEKTIRIYRCGDNSCSKTVDLSLPFGVDSVESERLHKISGEVVSYKDKLTIRAKTIEKVEIAGGDTANASGDKTSKADSGKLKECAEDYLKLQDGSVAVSKLKEYLKKEGFVNIDLRALMDEIGAQLIGDEAKGIVVLESVVNG